MVSHVSAAGIVNFFPAINGNKPVIHTTVQHAHTYTKVIIYIYLKKSLPPIASSQKDPKIYSILPRGHLVEEASPLSSSYPT